MTSVEKSLFGAIENQNAAEVSLDSSAVFRTNTPKATARCLKLALKFAIMKAQ
jgi:hypothetical protein